MTEKPMRRDVVAWVFLGIFVLAIVIVLCGEIPDWFRRSNRGTERVAATRPGTAADPGELTSEADRPARGGGPLPEEKRVLVSPLAGTWYPADRRELETRIKGLLEKVTDARKEPIQALVLPHAGYRYSGQTAAYGVKAVAGRRYRRVVGMGPTHRVAMENLASVPEVTHYATPLGEIPLDVAFIAALKKHPLFRTLPPAHRGEHSVQIELPLLQVALGDFVLVPIVVGQLDLESAKKMGRILLGLIDEKTLVVVSSDFTHYGPRFGYLPFDRDIAENLRKLDMGAYREIEKKDPSGFRGYVRRTGATICGRNPITVLLTMLPETSVPELLRYDTSGALTGDIRNSVSYLSIAFKGAWKKGTAVKPETQDVSLTDEEHKLLLALARRSIQHVLETGQTPEADDLRVKITPGLEVPRAAFVTLKKHGRLRGCIGEIFPQRPLYRSVMQNAVHAAFNDHRFPPVTASELPELEIKISALTPPAPIDSWKDIVIGKHGVVLKKDDHQAVFLPQVAPEQGWDCEQMLSHLAMKAGLPRDGWKKGATFTVFEAHVFGEDKADRE